ncbi:hypothetical protein E2553_40055 [Paraburkholderia dipogonis]|uniref:Uncharacterized protein n=1 Tax=Paraburkholderia dipogonis TaxID=1211383 RepID=A0A4Y8MJQ9_9BURK|nr:hypothetical protein [Paraburkholderia dipogonis]TFE37613.1 hypothetical protein E2553_40055 [Paraburkholderia dipogonis]
MLNRIAGIDQESLLANCRRDPVTLHFVRTCIQTMRALASRRAESLEDKLRRDRGELVVAEQMRQALTTMLERLGKGLDRLPDQVVERLGLPETSGDQIRALIDDLRRVMVDETRTLLS